MTRRAVLVCPGRGTYNRDELGSLKRTRGVCEELVERFDDIRRREQQPTVSQLDDSERFSSRLHMRSDNASALIYACSYTDYLNIDNQDLDIVAVTGNSMGWYTALACAGALNPEDGFELVNTMGSLMQASGVGGQLIYPCTDIDWIANPQREREILDRVTEINGSEDRVLKVSIRLGSMIVLAGNEAGLRAFEEAVPVIGDRFPMRLPNHAAFHTSLLSPVAAEARLQLANLPLQPASLPLVDGHGSLWYPHCYERDQLWDYTLGRQVTETYDFTKALRIAAFEFEPDMFVVLGPGRTLRQSVAQCLVAAGWRGLEDRTAFEKRQAEEAIVVGADLVS
ncbi:acyl-carrier domain protein [Luminiphilus syltensis NOR5-1B]|uniref:[acyl-carrier-protein] S-malonyltransferase n=1 Tax=Luminiphilus syltensis NOR5-1B TaxID=565045 RepID=B8KY49_9GAMM|nr:ACP S-malonyltransferase [Luminiphilus syltensis]EED34183.1 acyl-carrier domain protein [Luminiphilus syltensis NOR5-1B]